MCGSVLEMSEGPYFGEEFSGKTGGATFFDRREHGVYLDHLI